MLKKLFKYKLQFVSTEKPTQPQSSDDTLVDPTQEGEGSSGASEIETSPLSKAELKKQKQAESKAKKAKAKADKAAKKKGKPPKAKKKPKPKSQKHAEGKKSKKLPIIIAAAVLVVGGGVAAFLLLFSGPPPTPEELLLQAAIHTQEGEFNRSLDIYSQLLEDEELLPGFVVQAYLGMADTLVAYGDLEGAISRLQLGFEQTESPLISEMLHHLDPEQAPEPVVLDLAITWQDPELERLIRIAIERPSGAINQSDVAGITDLKILGINHVSIQAGGLNALNFVDGFQFQGEFFYERGNITTLNDLAHFTGLRRLTIGFNQVSDISGISGLTGLSTLGLYANNISDISALASLTNLENLFIFNNNITNIAPLSGLNNLRGASLQFNQISDLTPLAGNTSLRELFLSNNNISDISPLTGLSNLAFLGLQNNSISYLGPLESLPSLASANLAYNPA